MPGVIKVRIWKEKIKSYGQKVWKLINSNDISSCISILLLLAVFNLAGAGIFLALEQANEIEAVEHIGEHRDEMCDDIYDQYISEHRTFISKEDFRKNLRKALVDLDQEIFRLMQPGAFGSEDRKMWTFPGSVLFCASIYTTIGFGWIVPRTRGGRIAMYLYACVGIPLFFVLLHRIGERMAIVLEKLQNQLEKFLRIRDRSILSWLRSKLKRNKVEPQANVRVSIDSQESHERELPALLQPNDETFRPRAHSIQVHLPVLPPIISLPVLEDQSQIAGSETMQKQPDVAMSTIAEFHDHHHSESEPVSRRRYHSVESLEKVRDHEEHLRELGRGGSITIIPTHAHNEVDVTANAHSSETNIMSTSGHFPLHRFGKLPPIGSTSTDINGATHQSESSNRKSQSPKEKEKDHSQTEGLNFSDKGIHSATAKVTELSVSVHKDTSSHRDVDNLIATEPADTPIGNTSTDVNSVTHKLKSSSRTAQSPKARNKQHSQTEGWDSSKEEIHTATAKVTEPGVSIHKDTSNDRDGDNLISTEQAHTPLELLLREFDSEESLERELKKYLNSDEQNISLNASTDFSASPQTHFRRLSPSHYPGGQLGHFLHHPRMSIDSDSGRYHSDDETSWSTGRSGRSSGQPSIMEGYSKVSVPLAMVVLLVYMMLGCLLFMWLEQWDFKDAFFFVFVSLTTIGLGDIEPRNQSLFLVSTLYIIVGLALQSMLVNATSLAMTRTYKAAAASMTRATRRVRKSIVSLRSFISNTILHQQEGHKHSESAESRSTSKNVESNQSVQLDSTRDKHPPRIFIRPHHHNHMHLS